MILPVKYSVKKLALPLRIIHLSCKLTRSVWVGIFLIPVLLAAAGVALHYFYQENISRGMWLALFWASMTFAMLYHGQYRIQSIFKQFLGIIPDTKDAREKVNEVQAKTYAYINNKYYYIVSALVIAITLPIMHATFIARYQSFSLQLWGWLFFLFVAFVGGYGMACGIAFNRMVVEIIETTPFNLNPYHPDLFMGLKPLGNLSVVVALLASSSSLLFPLIFETIQGDLSVILGYLVFGVIMTAIIISFLGPLFIIKNKIEKEKYAVLIAHEHDYQKQLEHYKAAPTDNDKGVLEILLIEKAKLQDIRLFPFETKMISQILLSILLPIIMLFLEIQLR